MAAPPAKIQELVERFERNSDAYRSPEYKEARLRQEFVDPFFGALGWDMRNESGYAEPYKDVIHEDSIKVAGGPKAPDYCFRVGGTRKFFVEAKKPSEDVHHDRESAYQLRRYGWTAKLPLSILTDFEEFAVYDCRVRPAESDSASKARMKYLTYDDYLTHWDEIESVFAKDAILKGAFDGYAESAKKKRGTAEVDDAFLGEIDEWRTLLARNLALRNPKLTQHELNFAVARTIDRIIFLRMCEDRGIEDYGQLLSLRNGEQVYPRLRQMFYRADEKYNSGLFHFHKERGRAEAPDELTPVLKIDDKVLKDIFRALYYPDSPYEFSVLPPEILGHVYEQFLGKVIHLTKGHRARIEEKPEVRKAGGVYYTPQYIVDYIVKNTVGELLKGKTPREVAGIGRGEHPLRVLDPACGSGSFLLGAYQYLLDWHRDWYAEHLAPLLAAGKSAGSAQVRRLLPLRANEKRVLPVFQDARGEWKLTVAERKRILLSSMYGVDIDAQAVEVTKLSLLLKVLEGENKETLVNQLKLMHERALPDLASNIKCGNSLIGTDFYETAEGSDLSEEERLRVNPFDWDREFPDVFKDGGFDAVIGNPPYIRVRTFRRFYPEQVEYLEAKYSCAAHVWDVYLLLFEQGVRLAKNGGAVSFIVPIQMLHQPNCESLRRLLTSKTTIASVVDLSCIDVFKGPIVKNCILVCRRGKCEDVAIKSQKPSSPNELSAPRLCECPQHIVVGNPGCSLKVDLLGPTRSICEKLLLHSWRLEELCYVTFGMRSCAKGRGQGGKERLITRDGSLAESRPYLEGRDISRYSIGPTGNFIRYIPREMYSPREPKLFETKKIVSQSMLSTMRLVATVDEQGYYVEQSLVCIVPHGVVTQDVPAEFFPLEFLLGVVNSAVESFFFSTYVIDYSLGGGLVHATPGSQRKLVIPKTGASGVEAMVKLVRRMLKLHEQSSSASTPKEKATIEREVAATDREIDRLVYELYGLTDEEIRIVEEA